MRSSVEFRRTVLWLGAAAVAGALSGAAAGWWSAGWSADTNAVFSSTGATPSVGRASTGTSVFGGSARPPEVTVIPVERRALESVLPPPFAERGVSSVAAVYRRVPRKAGESGLLTDDRLLGQAVAVTSDGWFVLPRAALDGLHPSDIVIWREGQTATATRAIADRLSGVVFLKTGLANLPAPRLARPHDVGLNAAVWIERRALSFEALSVTALSEPATGLDGGSSETVARRVTLSGKVGDNDRGAPVWSAGGSLLGLVSSLRGEPLRVIPAAAWAQSLQSLLATDEMRHAYLGVRSADLSSIRFEQPSEQLPERGAWLRDDRRNRKLAVERNSPAALAGLRAGDVMQRIDRDILDGSADLAELLAEYKPGSQVTVTLLRGKETLEIPVTLGSIVTSEEVR